MRNPYVDLKEIISQLETVNRDFKSQQQLVYALITDITSLHQEYRLAKNYEVSDRLRKLLNDRNIRIVEGTLKFGGYENIPENMKGRMANDVWEYGTKPNSFKTGQSVTRSGRVRLDDASIQRET